MKRQRRAGARDLWKSGGLKAARKGFNARNDASKAKNTIDPRVMRGTGVTAFKVGDYEGCTAALQRLVDLTDAQWKRAEGGAKKSEYVTGYIYALLGKAYMSQAAESHDYNTCKLAQVALQAALKYVENAADPNLLALAAKCYEELGDWSGSLAIYGSIVAGFPRFRGMAKVTVRAAAVLQKCGRFQEALQYLEYILGYPPPGYRNDDMLFLLARAYELCGRKSDAHDTYRELHRLYQSSQMRKLAKASPALRNHAMGSVEADEGPSETCADYGSFKSWRAWHASPETWSRRAQRFLGELDAPLVASDALVELIRRDQGSQVPSAQPWLRLSRVQSRLRDSETSLQAAVKALEIDWYDHRVRAYISRISPDKWAAQFSKEEKNATHIQRVCSRGRRGRLAALRRREEVHRRHAAAAKIQSVARRRMGFRRVALLRRQRKAATCIQRRARQQQAVERVKQLRRMNAAAKCLQKIWRRFLRRREAATRIQATIRARQARHYVELYCRRLHGATKMQGCWRAYAERQIVRRLRRERNAARVIQSAWHAFLARKYVYQVRERFYASRRVQCLVRGYQVRRRVWELKSYSVRKMQRVVRGHFARARVATLRTTPRRYRVETPVVRIVRHAAVQPDCTWLSPQMMPDLNYLNDTFASDSIVSESSLLGAPEAKRISVMLYRNSLVRTLVLTEGHIGDEGMMSLASTLHFNTCLRTLALGPNQIGAAGATSLAECMLNHNYSLRHLCLDHNQIGPEGSRQIIRSVGDFFFRNYGHLECLTLAGVGVDDSCAEALGDCLYMNRRLLSLDLSDNNIGDCGATAIASGIKSNSTLRRLDLRGNYIRTCGGELLAEALASNRALQIVRIDCNRILDEAAFCLLDAFEKCPSLSSLTVSGNPIGVLTREKFDRFTDKRRKLLEETVSGDLSGGKFDGSRSSETSVTALLPKLRVSPVKRRGKVGRKWVWDEHNKPLVPTTLSDGRPLPGTPRQQLLAQNRPPVCSAESPLELESVIPPEMRFISMSLDSLPLPALVTSPVTHASPSVPHRMHRRRSPIKLKPRHTAKPRPSVFRALVQPPAMHINPIARQDLKILAQQPSHAVKRVAKSRDRHRWGGRLVEDRSCLNILRLLSPFSDTRSFNFRAY